MDFLRSWVDMLRWVGLKNVLSVGLVRSQSSNFFFSVHHMIPRNKISWTVDLSERGAKEFFTRNNIEHFSGSGKITPLGGKTKVQIHALQYAVHCFFFLLTF